MVIYDAVVLLSGRMMVFIIFNDSPPPSQSDIYRPTRPPKK